MVGKGGKNKGSAPNPPPGKAESPVMNVRLTPWLHAELNRLAEDTGLNRHELARRLLRLAARAVEHNRALLLSADAVKEGADEKTLIMTQSYAAA